MKSLIILIASIVPVFGWEPPIGVPEPNWPTIGNPIEATAPTPPSPWTSDIAGYYFVQTGGTSETNGYPGNPTYKIPATLPAGAKVFINGTFAWSHQDPYDVLAQGTAANPVWITSYDPENPATCTGSLQFKPGTEYVIVDNLRWEFAPGGYALGVYGGDEGAGNVMSRYVCFRNGYVKGTGIIDPEDPNYTSGSSLYNSSLFTSDSLTSPKAWTSGVEQLVLYNMTFTQGGNWQYASGDPDGSGAVIGLFNRDVWVVDCDFSYFSGGCAGFGIGTPSTPDEDCTMRCYIARNTATKSAQAGFWSKRSEDCVFSENVVHGIRRDAESMPNAPGVGGQYGPRRYWIIFNTIYDCATGIRIEGGVGTSGEPDISDAEVWIVGNVIYDIHDDPLSSPEPDWRNSNGNVGKGTAIHLRSGKNMYVINNTMHDFDAGIISTVAADNRFIEGNILSGRNPLVSGLDIYLFGDPGGLNVIDNNIIEGASGGIYVDNDTTVYTTLASLNTAFSATNISDSPDYVNYAAGNLRLSSGSPGIDAFGSSANAVYGSYPTYQNGLTILVDRDGQSRPSNTNWDFGAYEFGSVSPTGGTASATNANITTLNVQ